VAERVAERVADATQTDATQADVNGLEMALAAAADVPNVLPPSGPEPNLLHLSYARLVEGDVRRRVTPARDLPRQGALAALADALQHDDRRGVGLAQPARPPPASPLDLARASLHHGGRQWRRRERVAKRAVPPERRPRLSRGRPKGVR